MSNSTQQRFPSLEDETRIALETEAAAFHLNRRPQTLRAWACFENGPLRPLRINGRLAWRVSDLRRVLKCGSRSNHRPNGCPTDGNVDLAQGEQA
jgi:hypothetical protein